MASHKLAPKKNACTYAPVLTNKCQNVEAIPTKSNWYEAGGKQQIGLSESSVVYISIVDINVYILPAQAQKG